MEIKDGQNPTLIATILRGAAEINNLIGNIKRLRHIEYIMSEWRQESK